MDFRQSSQSGSSRPSNVSGNGPAAVEKKEVKTERPVLSSRDTKWFKVLNVVMLVAAGVLVAALALAIARGNDSSEFKLVNQSKYQAVFLNNGQVYFGNIERLNDKSVVLSNVYYLTQAASTDSKTTNSSYSLVKLGCQQIHDPYDSMAINRDQVTFWENLQDNGKVVTSINQFKKQNPNGPDCTQVSNQTQAATTGNTQGGSSSTNQSSTTTPSSNSSTK